MKSGHDEMKDTNGEEKMNADEVLGGEMNAGVKSRKK